MKRMVLAIGLTLMVGGCAAQQPPAPPPLNLAVLAPPKTETPPPPTAAQILAEQPSQVRTAIEQHEQIGEWPTYKTAGEVLYPYNEGPEPVVDCAPLRTTDIQLQPGETITDVAIGDSERWMATPASSGDPRNPLPHLAVKPQTPGIETNLTIYTTKHIYHLMLRSRGRAMQEVEFYYPEELLAALKAADAEVAKAKREAIVDPSTDPDNVVRVASADPAQLNFSYKVSGPNVPYKPIRAFDDGSHVYIQMPPGMKTSEAPALLIEASGGTQMVNYRVEGNYYVVDRLFTQAVMVSGVGREQDRATIAYAGSPR
ncbi:MAG: P-type conjugative transfer protein TrbG [Candidatus Binataceae bacterium]|jgi:type IV secretion system protein VirB9|nr:P-type conjugative transfer protein TrbG [Candidatus Binataceae bacterium]